MTDHQIHFNRKFYQDKKTGYWISSDYSKERPRVRAQQWVWINYNGSIPKGYHIHHIDGNKSNNTIENLELIKAGRHTGLHMNEKMRDPEKKKKAQEICEKIRPLTKKWHASEEGKAWHKFHALKSKFGNWEPKEYCCQQCNTKYLSKNLSAERTKFCSNNCKSAWRRKSGLDNVDKTCPICQKTYQSNKYARAKTCSRLCGRKI